MSHSASSPAPLSLDTPVVVPAGWCVAGALGDGPNGAVRRVPLREVFALVDERSAERDAPRRPGMVDLAAALLEVPAGEVLRDDSPTTAAVSAVARRLATLRRCWRAGTDGGSGA